MSFLYVRPDEAFTYGTATGTVDADYSANWLIDGIASRPVRRASGGLSITATSSARTVSLVAIINHNIATTVTISGGVSATVPAATLEPNGIYRNSFVLISPVAGATSLVMTASGTPAVVGELIAGTWRELGRQLLTGPTFEATETAEWEGEASSLPPYDAGVVSRRLTGETLLNDAGLQDVHDWHASTRGGSRPTLIVPVSTINDPWLVTFRYSWSPYMQGKSGVLPGIHRVFFEFVEVPRVRW